MSGSHILDPQNPIFLSVITSPKNTFFKSTSTNHNSARSKVTLVIIAQIFEIKAIQGSKPLAMNPIEVPIKGLMV